MFDLFFVFFSTILIGAGCVVVSARNTVYCALALIVAFINAGLLSLLLSAELICFVIMIVYVGAVAVLFLFVVMMLDLRPEKLKEQYGPYMRYALIIAAFLLFEVCLISYFYSVSPSAPDLFSYPRPRQTENVLAIGMLLYTQFILIFQIAGYMLLVAMIGAIVLTLKIKKNPFYKTQDISNQNKRSSAASLVLTQPAKGAGVTLAQAKHIIKEGHMEEWESLEQMLF